VPSDLTVQAVSWICQYPEEFEEQHELNKQLLQGVPFPWLKMLWLYDKNRTLASKVRTSFVCMKYSDELDFAITLRCSESNFGIADPCLAQSLCNSQGKKISQMNRMVPSFGPKACQRLLILTSCPRWEGRSATFCPRRGLQAEEPVGDEPVGCDHLALPVPLMALLAKCNCFLSLPNTVEGDRQATSLRACWFFSLPLSRIPKDWAEK